MLTVDKNLYYNQKHLQNILKGTQNQYLENINDPMNLNNFPLEVLKRKEWVRKNQKNGEKPKNSNNRVDMIGSGNIYDVSKVQTMIARENYFNQKYSKTPNNPRQSEFANQQEENLSRQLTQSRKSRKDEQSHHSYPSRNSYQSGYRESVEGGWPEKNMMDMTQERRHANRKSLNAKEHNDELFRKKSQQRKSVGYANIGPGI